MENDDRKDLIELGEKLKDSGRIEDLISSSGKAPDP